MENQIKDSFKHLHQLLDDEEKAMLNELKLEKEKKLESLKDKIEKIGEEIGMLTTIIKDLKKELDSGDIRIIQVSTSFCHILTFYPSSHKHDFYSTGTVFTKHLKGTFHFF